MVYPPDSWSCRTSECGLFGTRVSEGHVRTIGGTATVASGSEQCCGRCSICGLMYFWGSPGGSAVKRSPAVQETRVQSLGSEDPLEEGMATHSSVLAQRIPMNRGAWRATFHGVRVGQAHHGASLPQKLPQRGLAVKEPEALPHFLAPTAPGITKHWNGLLKTSLSRLLTPPPPPPPGPSWPLTLVRQLSANEDCPQRGTPVIGHHGNDQKEGRVGLCSFFGDNQDLTPILTLNRPS